MRDRRAEHVWPPRLASGDVERPRGDDSLETMRADGHEDMATALGHIRTAERIRDGFGEAFPPLPQLARPKLCPEGRQVPKPPRNFQYLRGDPSGN